MRGGEGQSERGTSGGGEKKVECGREREKKRNEKRMRERERKRKRKREKKERERERNKERDLVRREKADTADVAGERNAAGTSGRKLGGRVRR